MEDNIMKNLKVTGEFVMNGRFIDGVEVVEALAKGADNKDYVVYTPILDSDAEQDSSDFADYENYKVLCEA